MNMENDLAEKAETALVELASVNPQKALSTICGLLVGLVKAQCELQGHDADKEIMLDGNGESRSITIHAAKHK